MSDHTSMAWIILAAALATFLTRVGGYVLITRMRRIPPRLEAGLNAVPAAVLSTLVAPAFAYGGWDVALAMAAALAIALRYSTLLAMVAGCAAVVILRNAFGI
ncbi:AzlD family protein [Rhizobium sp. SG2393]|uniref:AzlD family protein n=1 Tax=Rhizobium sp. SG2393 TaxID=3276279 RepID=UPI00366BE3ED